MISIIHLGASGAVGTEVLKFLENNTEVENYTLLGRRIIHGVSDFVVQKEISIFDTNTYDQFVIGHDVAICTLGVGEPSKINKEEFIKIDKQAVIDFAKSCKRNGVKHFQLLASISINSKSSSFYLRTKGELVDELKALNFERLSVFMPSMILTPTNRYGFLQSLTLAFWPILDKMFVGKSSKFKGIKVEILGRSIAKNSFTKRNGIEYLVWEDFINLNAK